jgi:hypothetical protein
MDALDFPIFAEEPTDTVATPIGDRLTATLHCKSTSDRTDSGIQWYKDGVKINTTLNSHQFHTTNTSLEVSTTLSDQDTVRLEGKYYCVVSNTLGSIRSRSVFVRTQRIVPGIIKVANSRVFSKEETVIVAEGGYLDLPLSNNRAASWTVECDGEILDCAYNSCPLWHHVSRVGRLLFYKILRIRYSDIRAILPRCLTTSPIKVVDNFHYRLVLDINFGGYGFIPRRTIVVTQNVSVEIGGSTTLYCILNHPNSTYVWKRDDIHVANSSRYSFLIDGVLQIRVLYKQIKDSTPVLLLPSILTLDSTPEIQALVSPYTVSQIQNRRTITSVCVCVCVQVYPVSV